MSQVRLRTYGQQDSMQSWFAQKYAKVGAALMSIEGNRAYAREALSVHNSIPQSLLQSCTITHSHNILEQKRSHTHATLTAEIFSQAQIRHEKLCTVRCLDVVKFTLHASVKQINLKGPRKTSSNDPWTTSLRPPHESPTASNFQTRSALAKWQHQVWGEFHCSGTFTVASFRQGYWDGGEKGHGSTSHDLENFLVLFFERMHTLLPESPEGHGGIPRHPW